MPWRTRGSVVQVKRSGKWKKKARAKSPASARRMVNLLRGVKHGWRPTRRRK